MIILKYVLFGTLIYTCFGVGDVGDKCKNENDSEPDGMCILITDCPIAINEIRLKNNHRYNRCGFKGLTEIVCCPQEKTIDKFGDSDSNSNLERIADRECKKIVDSVLPPLDLHILGGEVANEGEFPHMCALGYDSAEGYDFQCGGTLLSNLYVLTAAHCLQNVQRITPTIVRLGVVDLGNPTRNEKSDVDIADIIIHPKYTRRLKYHDLALIRLAKAVQFSNNLNPICLYTSLNDPNMPLTVTGWGKTSNIRNVRSNKLLKANVMITDRQTCGKFYASWLKLPDGISDGQLCAGDPKGLNDTCQGDSGGPLQGLTGKDGHYRLVGVTSFGRGCGSSVPAVYTRVAKYLDWIESVVWPNK